MSTNNVIISRSERLYRQRMRRRARRFGRSRRRRRVLAPLVGQTLTCDCGHRICLSCRHQRRRRKGRLLTIRCCNCGSEVLVQGDIQAREA